MFDVGGVSCKAFGHSGKIMCVRPPKGEKNDFSDKNRDRVVIEFESLQVGRINMVKERRICQVLLESNLPNVLKVY